METSPEIPAAAHGRRVFFTRLFQVLAGLWAAGLAAGVLLYLRMPRRRLAEGSVRIGLLDELPPGQGRLVTGPHHPFWVVRAASGEVVALPAICTHRRCVLELDQEGRQLLCPCHGGIFDLNGNVLGGPPPRALEPLAAAVKGGIIYVYV